MQYTQTNNSATLLIHTCDRYEFLYKGFEIFFNLYWDSKIPTTNYFATEEKSPSVTNFKTIRSGKGEWSDRLIQLLTHDIKEDYIIYMQEDMWLTKPVNYQILRQLIDYTIQNSLDCVKLHSSEVYTTIPTGITIHGLALNIIDNKKSKYLMSHQITLWKKDYLLKQLQPNEHPWRNERRATKRMKNENPILYQIDLFAENGKAAINQNQNPTIRSEYFTISHNGILDTQIQYFIRQLHQQNLEIEYANQLQHHFENSLTHDGKTKPRKEDILQRLKHWLKL